jgi:hypothetical protein
MLSCELEAFLRTTLASDRDCVMISVIGLFGVKRLRCNFCCAWSN